MKKYRIKIIETVMYTTEVEARDMNEADDIVDARIADGSALGDGERVDIVTSVEEIKEPAKKLDVQHL